MKVTKAMMKKARALWRPKFEELPESCASCPFREGNEKLWRAMLNKLAAAKGSMPVTAIRAAMAREQIENEVRMRGDFICHHTAYTPEMDLRPTFENQQCAGAAEHYRSCK